MGLLRLEDGRDGYQAVNIADLNLSINDYEGLSGLTVSHKDLGWSCKKIGNFKESLLTVAKIGTTGLGFILADVQDRKADANWWHKIRQATEQEKSLRGFRKTLDML